MADQAIDPDMSTHTHHTQARVPAPPMPVHALAVDDLVAVVVDAPVRAVDAPVADITVTEHPL
jgi:hypothetical protein